MTLFEQLVSLSRADAIRHGARIERTNEEIVQDILFAEPRLQEAEELWNNPEFLRAIEAEEQS